MASPSQAPPSGDSVCRVARAVAYIGGASGSIVAAAGALAHLSLDTIASATALCLALGALAAGYVHSLCVGH